jgi:hypothetical protein
MRGNHTTVKVPTSDVAGLCIATLLWLLIFSSGLLVETIRERYYFAPDYYAKELGTQYSWMKADEDIPSSAWISTQAFFKATFCYIPTNLVCLALLSALIGGYASKSYVAELQEHDEEKFKSLDARRTMYLQENPWAAMTRGLVVYLCVIAGLYFIVDEPFKTTTPPQYIRLAGTISVLSFIVGFDPTQIDHWLHLGRRALPKRDEAATRHGNDRGRLPEDKLPSRAK